MQTLDGNTVMLNYYGCKTASLFFSLHWFKRITACKNEMFTSYLVTGPLYWSCLWFGLFMRSCHIRYTNWRSSLTVLISWMLCCTDNFCHVNKQVAVFEIGKLLRVLQITPQQCPPCRPPCACTATASPTSAGPPSSCSGPPASNMRRSL